MTFRTSLDIKLPLFIIMRSLVRVKTFSSLIWCQLMILHGNTSTLTLLLIKETKQSLKLASIRTAKIHFVTEQTVTSKQGLWHLLTKENMWVLKEVEANLIKTNNSIPYYRVRTSQMHPCCSSTRAPSRIINRKCSNKKQSPAPKRRPGTSNWTSIHS